MRVLVLIFINLLLCGFVSAEMRMWTDADGNRFAGEFSKILLGRILIKDQNGRTRSVPIHSLSKAEQDYLSAHVPPELEITVRKASRKLPKYAWSSPDYHTALYTFSITLEKTGKLDYKGELSVELFVIGHDLACESNDSFVLMHHSSSACRLPPGRKSICEILVEDVRFENFYSSVSRAASKRGKEYVGYIAAVFDSQGRMIACEENGTGTDWIEKDLSRATEKLRSLYEEGYGSPDSCHFKESFKKISPPRPAWFCRTEQY